MNDKDDTNSNIKPSFNEEKPKSSLQTNKPVKQVSFWLDIALNIIIIVGLVFIIRTFLISPFQVYGSSMCDTFNYFDDKCQSGYGEYIIVNKLGFQNFLGWQVGLPDRGDVIIFHPPHNGEEFFIKRVIGLPGETVEIKNRKVFIKNSENPQGFELTENYLNASNKNNTVPKEAGKEFNIPEDSYFVLGDNRKGSSDSRSCFKESISQGKCGENGNSPYLTLKHIEGKAMLVLWPVSNLSIVNNPEY